MRIIRDGKLNLKSHGVMTQINLYVVLIVLLLKMFEMFSKLAGS